MRWCNECHEEYSLSLLDSTNNSGSVWRFLWRCISCQPQSLPFSPTFRKLFSFNSGQIFVCADFHANFQLRWCIVHVIALSANLRDNLICLKVQSLMDYVVIIAPHWIHKLIATLPTFSSAARCHCHCRMQFTLVRITWIFVQTLTSLKVELTIDVMIIFYLVENAEFAYEVKKMWKKLFIISRIIENVSHHENLMIRPTGRLQTDNEQNTQILMDVTRSIMNK